MAVAISPQASVEVPGARPLYFFAGSTGRNRTHVRDAVARRDLLTGAGHDWPSCKQPACAIRDSEGGTVPRNPHWRVPSTWRSERTPENLGLSRPMEGVLRASAESGSVADASVETITALCAKGLCDGEGALNAYGTVVAISLVPLQRQCCILGFRLDERRHAWDGRPEPAGLLLSLEVGAWGYADEGRVLHALIHALVFPRLYSTMSEAWNKSGGSDRARSWLYGSYAGYNDVLDFAPDLAAQMLADIHAWDRPAFVESWRTLGEWNADNHWKWHPATTVRPDQALAILEAVGVRRLAAVAAQVFTDPYAYYHGWPDLMVLTPDGRLDFIEVKTTDRLHYGQIITMADMRNAAHLEMSVLCLKRER